ncbi:thermonuclease family protein [Tessaracoccus sp. SD287]|uniref:thermonuclease family protein n=1 Tax=Tessaracoccus sp. SD287 TaxID=2782008 RepID=UPI001A96D2FC|nr:thermonuclease family protein [Tessaracoccus sp. SD287]MBO1030115.1 thermonuclease family protein [Tessaracoccus sp. SD287]
MGKLVAGLLAAVVTVGGIAAAADAINGREAQTSGKATVVRVIDGDTLVAQVDGVRTTIRLLNVDTPETKHPNVAPECLGVEATVFLTERLPVGTHIDLEYDQELLDPYGRTLAAVTESGQLVNAEIARKGLGAAVVYRPNDKFHGAVLRAQQEAQAARVGLYDPKVACTLPAQVASTVAALESLPEPSATDAAAALAALGMVAAAIEGAQAVESALDDAERGVHAVRRAAYEAGVPGYRKMLRAALTGAREKRQRHTAHHAALVGSEEAARKAAEARKAEEARKADESRKALAAQKVEEERKADEARRAEQARKAAQEREAAAKKAQQRKLVKAPATKRPSAPKTTSKPKATNPYPGYTGPRCYAPGGKTWKPC